MRMKQYAMIIFLIIILAICYVAITKNEFDWFSAALGAVFALILYSLVDAEDNL